MKFNENSLIIFLIISFMMVAGNRDIPALENWIGYALSLISTIWLGFNWDKT